jgi:hypothetical protein
MRGISGFGSRHALAAVLRFGLLALTAHNALNPDLWSHLRTGQWTSSRNLRVSG